MKRLLLAVLTVTCTAFNASAAPAFLPDEDQVRTVIDELPSVQAAIAREREAGARGDAMRDSPYGYELSIMPLARHERRVGTYGEVESTLTKRMRLPAKTRLDSALAEAGESIARFALGDARHEGARRLLDAWVSWVRAAGLARLAELQRATLEDERKAVARRVALGDLPVLDERRAAAAVAEADMGVERARLEREQARLALAVEFPSLALPSAVPGVPAPLDLEVGEDAVARMIEHSHELMMARAQAARQGVAASRADAERRPDPSFGLRVLSEGDGNEQAVGVVLSIPFAASGQSATVRAERALGEAIDSEVAGIARRVRLDAEKLLQALPARHDAWAAAARMVDAADDALARVEKAWQLGAADLSELLLARRYAFEARVSELGLRLDAQALAARIEIDSHQRWAANEAD